MLMPIMDKNKVVVIVDAYSAGRFLAPEFKKRGYRCAHVQSSVKIPDVYAPTFISRDFFVNIKHDGDYSKTLNELRVHDVGCVIAGIESGVQADALSEALGLLTNGTKLSEARRNKYLMNETLRRAGIPAVAQIKSGSIQEVLAWFNDRQRQPMIVKPVHSAGTDSVALCRTEREVIDACEAILGKKNRLDLLNSEVLAQEFLEGTEYVVNTVSYQGRRQITEIWKYAKVWAGNSPIYDNDELLDLGEPGSVQDQLVQYTFQFLDALGIQNGPAHSEIMMTARGPILVETAARLDGTTDPNYCLEYSSNPAVELVAEAYVDQEAFLKRAEIPYRLRKHAVNISLISEIQGTAKAVPLFDEVTKLQSFHHSFQRVRVGQEFRPTVDMFTAPGLVSLCHEDSAVVWKDYDRVRWLEKNGGYVV
jgi:biotin carboxylase